MQLTIENCPNYEFFVWIGRNHCGKRGKCCLITAFPPISHNTFKLFLMVFKTQTCVAKDYLFTKKKKKKNKNSTSPNSKQFADNKNLVTQNLISFIQRKENIVEIRINSGDHNFILFSHCFQKCLFTFGL